MRGGSVGNAATCVSVTSVGETSIVGNAPCATTGASVSVGPVDSGRSVGKTAATTVVSVNVGVGDGVTVSVGASVDVGDGVTVSVGVSVDVGDGVTVSVAVLV